MLYTLNLDKDNYILSIANTPNDNVELDLSSMELQYLQAYKYENDTLSLDENRKQELIKEQQKIKDEEEIYELEGKLNSTDYIMARMLEEIMVLDKPLTFIADMIKIFVSYGTKYKEQLANRKSWRERIEELRK